MSSEPTGKVGSSSSVRAEVSKEGRNAVPGSAVPKSQERGSHITVYQELLGDQPSERPEAQQTGAILPEQASELVRGRGRRPWDS